MQQTVYVSVAFADVAHTFLELQRQDESEQLHSHALPPSSEPRVVAEAEIWPASPPGHALAS